MNMEKSTLSVVYFDQLLGAAHPRSCSKSLFSAKKLKNEKIASSVNYTKQKTTHLLYLQNCIPMVP